MAEEYGRGLVPRDFAECPPGYMASAPVADESYLLPESEWKTYLDAQKAYRSSLNDLRETYYSILRSLNQGRYPLCWAFSTTKAFMYILAKMGSAEILSAWWTAGIANGWKSQGGWCTLSLEAFQNTGGVKIETCPNFSRSYVTPEAKAEAARRKAVEWVDGKNDRDFNRRLMISAFLRGDAPALDYNHIAHSMAGCYIESLSPLKIYADNSWDAIDQYGPKGLYMLKERNAIPDNIIVARVLAPNK